MFLPTMKKWTGLKKIQYANPTWEPGWTSLSSDTISCLSSLSLLSWQAFVKQKTSFKTHTYQFINEKALFLTSASWSSLLMNNHLFLLGFQANQGFRGNLSVQVVQALRGFLGHLGVREDRRGRESCCGIRREPGSASFQPWSSDLKQRKKKKKVI